MGRDFCGLLCLGFMRVIIHADLNSFFASAEQQSKPKLRGKPLGILKAKGRTCVIAASDEAKAFGVKTGCSIYEARIRCPKIIFVPADFDKYEVMTQKFIRLSHAFSDKVEVFSLDEVFLDVSDTAWWFGGAFSLAKKLQLSVCRQLGEFVGCSVGIAGNKLLAKMASGMAPRRGILAVTEKNKAELLARAPFSEVCGIGYRLTKKLAALGVMSLPAIAALTDKTLLSCFGPYWGKELKRLAKGEDNSPVVTTSELRQAKSVSRTYTLYHDTTDQRLIKAFLRNLVEEAAAKMRQMDLAGRQFGVVIRGGGQSQSGHITTKTCIDDGRQVFEQIYTIYNSWHWPYPVRFAGAWISLLEPKINSTLPLFGRRQDNLLQTVDKINCRYGDYTVFPATLINQRIIRPEVNGYLGDKQFYLKRSSSSSWSA